MTNKKLSSSLPRLAGLLAWFLAGPLASGVVAAAPLACLIEPELVTEIGTPVAGVLDSVPVDRGDRVTRGQVLAKLRADVERAGIDSAKARAGIMADLRAAGVAMNYAHDKLKRSEGLVDRGFISPLGLAQVRSEYQVAQQKYHQAKEQQRIASEDLRVAHAQLGVRVLKSPFDGVVLDRYANPGERVELKPILKVAKIDQLRIEVVMPANQFGGFKPGDSATVTADIPGAQPTPARVTIVDQAVDAASNTFRVRLALPNENSALPASARCRIEFAGGVSASAPAAGKIAPGGLTLKHDASASRKPDNR